MYAFNLSYLKMPGDPSLTLCLAHQMILVASSEKPLERTLKGTTRRGVCLKLYAKEIEDMYSFDGTSLAMREFRERM